MTLPLAITCKRLVALAPRLDGGIRCELNEKVPQDLLPPLPFHAGLILLQYAVCVATVVAQCFHRSGYNVCYPNGLEHDDQFW